MACRERRMLFGQNTSPCLCEMYNFSNGTFENFLTQSRKAAEEFQHEKLSNANGVYPKKGIL